MKKGIIPCLLLCLFTLAGKAEVLELATVQENDHVTVQADRYLEERVEAETGGNLTITVGAAGQLYGDEAGILEALEKGDVALGHVSVRTLAGRVPELSVFSLPYLFGGAEHLKSTLDHFLGSVMASAVQERMPGLVVLGWYDNGGRCFYTKTQVVSAPDLNGLTLAAEETEAMDMFLGELGAKRMTLGRHTVFSAIHQGVVDGGETDLPSLLWLGDYDGAPYIFLDRHTFAPDILLMSAKVYERLSEEEQQKLMQAARKTEGMEWELLRETETEAINALREYGCTLSMDDGGARESFTPMAEKTYSLVDPALIEEIRNMK